MLNTSSLSDEQNLLELWQVYQQQQTLLNCSLDDVNPNAIENTPVPDPGDGTFNNPCKVMSMMAAIENLTSIGAEVDDNSSQIMTEYESNQIYMENPHEMLNPFETNPGKE